MTQDERERWNERYESQLPSVVSPHPSLVRLRDLLPKSGRMLDAGGGTGRNSIWAAKQGFDVTLADISEEAIKLARQNAKMAHVEISYWCTDLDDADPPERFDVLLCANFLQPAILDRLDQWVLPGGIFVMLHPTYRNLERHEKPSRRFLVEPEQVVARLPAHERLHFDADWRSDDRHEMELVCRITE